MIGKCYNIDSLVTYNEEIDLYYPANKAEFDKLNRTDIEFDSEKVGSKGTPLRYPSNSAESKLADLERNFLGLYSEFARWNQSIF